MNCLVAYVLYLPDAPEVREIFIRAENRECFMKFRRPVESTCMGFDLERLSWAALVGGSDLHLGSYHSLYLSQMGIEISTCLTLLKAAQCCWPRMNASYKRLVNHLEYFLLCRKRLTFKSQPEGAQS